MAVITERLNHLPRQARIAIVAVVILALVVLVVLLNWGSVLDTGTNVLNFLFDSAGRVDQSKVIECDVQSSCSTVHAFVVAALILLTIITGFAYTTLLERKFIAWFQQRVGPNRVGPMGLLQPAADGLKLIFKEDIIPDGADKPVYYLAPLLKVIPVLIILAVVPLGPKVLIPWFDGYWYHMQLGIVDVNVGVLWILALTSVGTYGVVLAGWSSNNKYAMIGALRASAQMISYELSLGLTMAVPILIVGSMSIGDIVNHQVHIYEWFIFQNPLAAGVLFVAFLAELNRSPFDLPEAEQELTQGFMTEYSAMKFALFMMAEYLGMIALSAVFASLFLGGYQDGFGIVNSLPILGPLVMLGKVVLLLIFMIWVRATLPRIRYDRLMTLGWKVMFPLALLSVAWSAVAVVVSDTFHSPIAYGLVGGGLFTLILVVGYLALRRSGQLGGGEEEEQTVDPIISGERKGVGYAGLQVLGGILAGPFVLYNFTLKALDSMSKLSSIGEEEKKDITPAGQSTPAEKPGAVKESGSGD